MGRLGIGIDIGGTHLRAGVVTAAGVVLAEERRACPREAEAVLALCLELVGRLRREGVEGIGVGVPGRVDAGRNVALSGGYVDLSRVPFAARLAEITGLPVRLENDAAMALLAEAAAGAARGCRSAAMLTLGTGIGGAALEDGRLLRGRAAAGQLGHMVVEPEGLPCLCGRRGCLETASAGPALARHARQAGLPEGTRVESLLGGAEGTPERSALVAWAAPLRRAVDSLVAALDPEVVVLGGGLGAAAAEALALLPAPASWYHAPVRAAALGDAAGVIGAGLAALPTAAKRLLLVNGVPASGKSGVARALSGALGWPLLALDTVKGPFLAELPPGDRTFNRTLGRAALRAMMDVAAAAPEGAGFVLDAWFGFQPLAVLEGCLPPGAALAEVWCEAPPEEVGRRYAARVPSRGPGHPGLDYVPELVALAARAAPLGLGPVLRVDTARPLDLGAAQGWVEAALGPPKER